jgi:HD-GYP domain-containing protein (c-di-GMP phosphodiesterase class II)
VGGAIALTVASPGDRPLEPGWVVAFALAYALASRIEFDSGAGYTVPTQLVFVPMALVLPLWIVPPLVAAGYIAGRLPELLLRRSHVHRVLVLVADAWYALPPVVVLALAAPGAPRWSYAPAWLAALVAQVVFEAPMSALRQRLAYGARSSWQQFRELAWVYLLDAALSCAGVLIAFGIAREPYAVLLVLPILGLFGMFASERQVRIRSALALSHAYRGTALLLGDIVEDDDEYTGAHTQGVVALATEVSQVLGLRSRVRQDVELAALLHDVGKVRIPNEIINKAGKLTQEEMALMRTHTIEGYKMLERFGGLLGDIGVIVRSCHERWDGAGYPDGLAGEDIPLAARIVFCCDAYNAMTTDRSYRKALPVEVAVQELEDNAGTQFDPRVVAALVRVVTRDAVAAAPAPAAALREPMPAPALVS